MGTYKIIDRYPDYEIDESGNVRKVGNKEHRKTIFVRGYEKVNIKGNTEYIHRLVAETYLENPNNFSDVTHKDGNKRDNSIDNLKWTSHSENQKRSYGLGINAPGGAHPPKQIEIVETGEVFPSIRSCARHIHGTPSGIRSCLRGQLKTYKGHTFHIF